MSQLALSASFEYLCYGSTSVINTFTLTVRGANLDVRVNVANRPFVWIDDIYTLR